ncbi:MAG: hypothetical protein A2087_00335 [Spirochaetes bacterium GWD1_61_31]|nr:MAG: hypothetical protein A2Y37_00495 [Spirochaetes bacterium GWB1_60_80]OHD35514.1 MAG: hypothetical protein A2004_01200 [Spirochaetes bacterium GWC1_61_12]OHD39003.1 MAG: hypothetical protein A2087_00335 [Spirochaetes bacterium GWD1_61_31]OHD43502.1 MAG: hypothetical protein A2Y35_14935 [Spirochaetes bacterium GWE1_60_18]OHD60765.1 MAG: hypothetical protein A2Y32_07835 [Spirochaetes bacterium GWF1_60_12]HAP44599.1 hypothetical protein [Spirochaetaceae bacterium]
MEEAKRLYMVVHPNHALIASQLDPEHFARHYTQGSTRYFEGRLIFVEIDPAFRHPYFKIDHAFEELKQHEDGRPKATKFISSYRTLEHIDYAALGKLYYCNSLGDFVELTSADYDPTMRGDEMRIILEINPIKMMVLTHYNFLEYAKYITDPSMPKGAPKMFYSQLEFNVDDFLKEFQDNPFIRCFVPGIHPARLREAIHEVRSKPGKKTKGLSLDCPVDRISYKHLRHGFMFASQDVCKFYPLLPLEDVERKYYKFWKNM